MPLFLFPATILTPILGKAAFFVVPITFFGVVLAKAVDLADSDPGDRRCWAPAVGFAGGALMASFLAGDCTTPGFLPRVLLTAVTAVAFALCMTFGSPASLSAGG
jgi:hypothetical protein